MRNALTVKCCAVYLASIVDGARSVARSPQIAEVNRCAVPFPEDCVRRRRVWGNCGIRAQARRAHHLTPIVNPKRESDRIAGQRLKFPDFAIWFPKHGFKLNDLMAALV